MGLLGVWCSGEGVVVLCVHCWECRVLARCIVGRCVRGVGGGAGLFCFGEGRTGCVLLGGVLVFGVWMVCVWRGHWWFLRFWFGGGWWCWCMVGVWIGRKGVLYASCVGFGGGGVGVFAF